MATFIGVRSPYFITIQSLNAQSFRLNISVDGVLVYSIFKQVSDEVAFEIANLVRDYINISYDGVFSGTPLSDYGADLSIVWTAYDDPEGSVISFTGGVSLDAYDAYAFFEDQSRAYSLSSSVLLLSSNTIWLPENTSGAFYYLSSLGVVTKQLVSSTATVVNIPDISQTVNVRRYPCSKYTPNKLVFINRFGMPQDIWFFGKTIESASFSSDQYKSSNINFNGSFSKYEHQFKKFNVNGSASYVLNSGFVSEEYNDLMKELLLSEQVWLHIDNQVKPVMITSSDFSYKTGLNDKLITYTLEVQESNDIISSMR